MFESHRITLQCPKCSCKSYHRRGWLQTNPTLTCAQCGVKIVIKADDLRRGLEGFEREIQNIVNDLKF